MFLHTAEHLEMPVVYEAINRLNGHNYIGSAKYSLADRQRTHLKGVKGKKRNIRFHAAIRRYGFDAFDWKVLAEFVSHRDALAEESRLIIERKPYYNVSSGAMGVSASLDTLAWLDDFSAWQKDGASDATTLGVLLKRAEAMHIKPVICLNDARVWPTITDASRHYGLTTDRIVHVLDGSQKKTGGYYFIRARRLLSMRECEDEIAAIKIASSGARSRSNIARQGRSIVCLNDGRQFAAAALVAAHYALLAGNIAKVCDGKRPHAGGLSFAWANHGMSDEQICQRVDAAAMAKNVRSEKWRRTVLIGHIANQRAVLCETDGLIFNSIKAAAQYYGVDASSIGEHCATRARRKTVGGKTFVRLEAKPMVSANADS